MKMPLPLLVIFSVTILLFSACGGTADKAGTITNANASGKETTAAPKTDAPAAGGLKPADVSPDKAVKVAELADAATADEAAWRGKEVTVSGYVWDGSGAAENIVTVTNDEKSVRTTTVSCHLEGKKPEGLNNKTVEFKGTVSYTTKFGDSKGVNLKPCALRQ